MKKTLVSCFLFLLAAGMTLTACRKPEAPAKTEMTDRETHILTVAAEQTHDSEPTDQKKQVHHGGELRTTYLPTYDEYLRFLKETEGTEKVLRFDTLKRFGEFKSFYTFPVFHYSEYMYSFDDGFGFSVYLWIEELPTRKDVSLQKLDPTGNASDLACLEEDVSGYQMIGEAQYQYLHGKLLWIRWEESGLLFTLSTDPSLDKYPRGLDTFISELLDRETASACLDSLNREIAKARS